MKNKLMTIRVPNDLYGKFSAVCKQVRGESVSSAVRDYMVAVVNSDNLEISEIEPSETSRR